MLRVGRKPGERLGFARDGDRVRALSCVLGRTGWTYIGYYGAIGR
jgi:hypothetical protein